MAIVRPFRGLRPKPELAKKVASPPYDVLSTEEAREQVKSNPDSFLRVNKSEVDFPPEQDQYSIEVYEKGRENLERLIQDGIMVRDEQPCFYLYRLTWKGKSQTGLVALTSVDEYDKGLIKKHEHTRPAKVNDRASHIVTLNAQVGPVFSTFRHTEELKSLFARLTAPKPDVDFIAVDDVQHQLWVISDRTSTSQLQAAFGKLKEMYIADGHHRSQAGSEVCRRMREKHSGYSGTEIWNYFMNVIFPDEELRILPYNRVVKDLNGLTPDGLINEIEKNFKIERGNEAIQPQKPCAMGLYCNRQWYRLNPREGTFDSKHPVKSIDSAILTANLLDPVLGIKDIRTDDRIDFVGGIRGVQELVKLVDSGEYKVAFSMYPVSVKQLLAVADANEVMPPKSTWFEPKLRSGMVVNLLSE